jgi:peptide/nickel transport system permease protein
VLGILSGYLGGWADQVVMRVTDTWLALPALTFAIFLAAIVGPSELNIILILGLVYWTRYARVIRGEVLSLKQREFVRLAIVAGCSKGHHHAAPHPAQRHQLGDRAGHADAGRGDRHRAVAVVPRRRRAAAQAGLGPDDGRRQEGLMVGYWWLTVFPGICIMLMVLSANLLGDWLRVKLDPQLRQL